MDANDIMNALNGLLDLCDTLDNNGIGAGPATNWEHTTRDICKTELGTFLMYVGAGGSFFTDGQATLVNLLLSEKFGQIESWQMKSVADGLDAPLATNNATFTIFKNGDDALSQQNGTPTSQLTDMLISLYESFGGLMVAFNENALSKVRCDLYVNGLKARQGTGSFSSGYPGSDSPSFSSGIIADDDFDIEDDVLLEYSGTDTDVIIPRGITRIEENAFFENETIERVTIPAGVKSIGDGAFWGCTNLKDVIIPEGVTEIDAHAFYDCESLESVELPSTLSSIGDDAFSGCDKLKRIKVPAALKDIGKDVFYNCDKLEAVIVCGKRHSAATINHLKDAFQGGMAVFWEGDPQESVIVGQVIRSGHNVSYAFKPDLVLSLPEDQYSMEIVEEELHEGDLKVVSESDHTEDDSVKGLLFRINTPWGSGEDMFKKIEGWFGNIYFFKKAYQTIPRSHMMINDGNYLFNLAFSKEKVLQVRMDSFFSNENKHRNAMRMLVNTLDGLMINGEKFSFGSMSSDELIEEWMTEYTAGCRKKEEENERKFNEKVEKGKQKVKKHTAKYNDLFSFDLPAGQELIWKDGEDGTKTGEISAQVLVNEDGELNYNKLIVISDLSVGRTEENAFKDKSDLELKIQTRPGCRHKKICDNPETELVIADRAITVMGSEMKIVEADIIINYAPDHILQLLYADSLKKVIKDKSEIIRLVMDAAKSIRFNGKPLQIADLDCEQLGQEMILEDFEAESSGTVGLRVVVNGKEVARRGTENDEEKDGIPYALPQVSDQYHEHYTLVTSGKYTTRRDADFVGQPIRMLMEKSGSEDEDAYDFMQIVDDDYTLDREAVSLAKVFRLNEELFDPYEDTEALIRLGMFQDAKMFQALRSLAWIIFCKADREGKQPGDYNFEELEHIGEAIAEDYLHYCTESYCSGLCSHYDWHVFYVPDKYLKSKCRKGTDLRYLTGKENRGGNTINIFIPGVSGFGDMNRNSDIISRNEETLTSLEDLRKDLTDLLPVMKTVCEGLMRDRNRNEKKEGVLAEALTAWCALAIAAKEPFYSEEAADTPEADAGLEGPLERPTDDLDDKPAAKSASKPVSKTAAKPSGEVLDLGGATVIEPGQFAGNMALKKIVIPEGVTEIGANAFYTCMGLEAVVFPKSLRKIGKMAFMSCRNLREVDLPEGVEEIETHAFGATNNLKQVHLPDSLKKVDRCLFGLGGDSPYATAYLSGKLAKQLYDVSGDQFNDIYARHLIIDGKPYESVKEFLYKEFGIRANGYYVPYDPEAERRAAEQRKEKYRSEMEKACKEGKTLEEMIEAGRKVLNAKAFGDREAFEQAIENLDREATVTFAGKHFALTGFGDMEEDVIAEIEKRGGTVHSSMTKSANYLIVCLDGPGSSKVKKALEWRQKGAQNQIVSDYQMWQAIFGKTAAKKAEPKDKEEAKPAVEPAAAPKKAAPKAKAETKPAAPKEKAAAKPKTAPAAKPAPKPAEPENEAADKDEEELERRYQMYAPKDSQLTAEEEKLLRMIIRMGGPQHKTVRLKDIAFELDATIDETKKMLGGLKDKLVLEWNSSGSIDFFMPRWRKEKAESSPAASVYTPGPAVPAPAPTASAPRPAAPAPAPKPVMPSQNEQKRNEIRQKIARLESERDSLKGLFAGFKRKKIQAEIDALKDELRRI